MDGPVGLEDEEGVVDQQRSVVAELHSGRSLGNPGIAPPSERILEERVEIRGHDAGVGRANDGLMGFRRRVRGPAKLGAQQLPESLPAEDEAALIRDLRVASGVQESFHLTADFVGVSPGISDRLPQGAVHQAAPSGKPRRPGQARPDEQRASSPTDIAQERRHPGCVQVGRVRRVGLVRHGELLGAIKASRAPPLKRESP